MPHEYNAKQLMENLSQTLESVYGTAYKPQLSRYVEALNRFRELYGAGDVAIFRAPGRVNFIGEHTDYNHGFVMPIALDKDTLVFARPRKDAQINLANSEAEFAQDSFTIAQSIRAEAGHDWSNYARGVAQMLQQKYPRTLKGMDVLVQAEAPFGVARGAGLSSSSSLTIAIMLALGYVNAWQASLSERVQLASDAEWYVGTRGGIMDHYISLKGLKGHALFLDCRPDEKGLYQTEAVALPEGYDILIINSGVKHQNVAGGYNWRVAACLAGVGILKKTYPEISHLRDVQEYAWETLEPLLPEVMTVAELAELGIDLSTIPTLKPETPLEIRAKCRHVYTENQRVLKAVEAMKAGDVVALAGLLRAAHLSARDDYAISCSEIEVLVELLEAQKAVLATRLTGAGWGGCVLALVEKEASIKVAQEVKEAYFQKTRIHADSFLCQASQGAALLTSVEI